MHGITLTSGISGNKAKPSTYNSRTSFETYELQFEAASIANNWSEEEKVTVIIRWRALDLLCRMFAADKDDYSYNSYDYKLFAAVDMHFGEQHLQQLLLAQLSTCKLARLWGRSEKANMYIWAYPTVPADVLEEMVNWKLIEGMRDDTVINALLPLTHSTTRKALGNALDVETAYKTYAAKWGQCKVCT